MRPSTFIILHSLILIGLALSSRLTDILVQTPNTSLLNLIGFAAIEIAIIVALELLVFAIARLAINPVKKILLSIWGLLLFPSMLFSISDIGYALETKSPLNWDTFWFGITEPSTALKMAWSESNIFIVSLLFISIPVGLFFFRAGYQTTKNSNSKLSSIVIAVVCLVFLTTTARHELTDNNKSAPILASTSFSRLLNRANNIYKIRTIKKNIGFNKELLTPIKLEATSNKRPPNLVFIILENTRFDATTPYNNDLDTTPFLNQLAQQGMLVKDAYITTQLSSKSLVAIMCGIPPDPTPKKTELSAGGIPRDCLPSLLKPLGYSSAFFQPTNTSMINKTLIVNNIGFDSFTSLKDLNEKKWEKVNYFGIEEKSLTKPVTEWVDKQEKPFLLTIFTLSSHHYYGTPKTFDKKKYAKDKNWNNYLNTVRYVDSFIEELFAEFENRGLIENTLFVITGDHGQTFLPDHGLLTHNAFQETLKVPLILYNKNLIGKPKQITGLRQHTDIIPTIIDLFDLKISTGHFPGKSLLKKINNRTIYAYGKFDRWLTRISSQQKFIYNFKYPALAYDIEKDLKEKNNLIKTLPQNKIDQYTQELFAWKQQLRGFYETGRQATAQAQTRVQGTTTNAINNLEILDYQLASPPHPNQTNTLTIYFTTTSEINEGELSFSMTIYNEQAQAQALNTKTSLTKHQTSDWLDPGEKNYTLNLSFYIPRNIAPEDYQLTANAQKNDQSQQLLNFYINVDY